MLKLGFAVVLTLFVFALMPNLAFAEQSLSWNGKEIKGWVCDGKELKPKFGATSSNTWVFNGREIHPKSGANSSNTWIFDGKELRPKFGANSSNTWIIDGSKARPKFGATSSNTWKVGNAPILVIAGALVLHLY